MTSATTLKLRAAVAKITTVGEHHIMTIETTMIAIKTFIEARGKLRRWS
jgi:hypothetical protein